MMLQEVKHEILWKKVDENWIFFFFGINILMYFEFREKKNCLDYI